MATIIIKTTEEERLKVLEAIKQSNDETISIGALARLAGLSDSRTRYAIADLVEAGKVQKIPTKRTDPRYIRYKYKIV